MFIGLEASAPAPGDLQDAFSTLLLVWEAACVGCTTGLPSCRAQVQPAEAPAGDQSGEREGGCLSHNTLHQDAVGWLQVLQVHSSCQGALLPHLSDLGVVTPPSSHQSSPVLHHFLEFPPSCPHHVNRPFNKLPEITYIGCSIYVWPLSYLNFTNNLGNSLALPFPSGARGFLWPQK